MLIIILCCTCCCKSGTVDSFSNGTIQSSKVASITNTLHRLQSNPGLDRKICMAIGEKSQPYTLSFASRLYFKIGKSVFPTPQPSSKILLHSCAESLGASSGNSILPSHQ
uniref:Uncharacterized protein n=1 Tax=Glossina austeni TaxID=7395 RepID=A0A1A9V485_GLOAU